MTMTDCLYRNPVAIHYKSLKCDSRTRTDYFASLLLEAFV